MGGGAIAVLSVVVILFSGQLAGLFVESAGVAEIVAGFFKIVSVGYVMYMLTSCYLGVLSGMGKPGLSMLLFFLYYIIVRIPLAGILVRTGMGVSGVWTAILLSHVIAAAAAALVGNYEIKRRKQA